MAITMDDALKLFHCRQKNLRDPLDGTNPIYREVNEALAARMPESEIAEILVAAYRRAKYAAMEELEAATRARKARIPIKATKMPR